MLFFTSKNEKAILSPCIGVCTLDGDGFCEGCHRTLDEIAQWTALTNDQRQHLMNVVLPQREMVKQTKGGSE